VHFNKYAEQFSLCKISRRYEYACPNIKPTLPPKEDLINESCFMQPKIWYNLFVNLTEREKRNMSKIELVRQEMIKAMKAGDAPRKEALSMLLAALKKKAIDKRADLTEEEENAVVFKEIKEAQEALDSAPASRTDIIEENRLKISIYSEFAPKLLSEDEVRAEIKKVLAQLGIEKPSPKDKGNIMKAVMPVLKGKADGKMVNKLVDELTRG